MKHKNLIVLGILAIVFIAAMIVYKDNMSFTELLLAFTTAATSLGWSWSQTLKVEVEKKLDEKEDELELSEARYCKLEKASKYKKSK